MAQPVIIEDSISIAANSVNNNVIVSNASLRKYLRAPFRARGKLLAVQSAAGLTIDLDAGSKNFVASSNPRVVSAFENPNDIINEQWHVEEGDQLVLRASNNTGGALTLRYRIELHPVDERGPDCRVIQQGPTSIADNTTDSQLLDGLRYERPPMDALLDIFMSASAAGLTRTLDIDTDNIAPPSAVNATNRIPQDPFDMTITGVETPQDKLTSLAVTNRSGGALNVFWKAKWYELAVS